MRPVIPSVVIWVIDHPIGWGLGVPKPTHTPLLNSGGRGATLINSHFASWNEPSTHSWDHAGRNGWIFGALALSPQTQHTAVESAQMALWLARCSSQTVVLPEPLWSREEGATDSADPAPDQLYDNVYRVLIKGLSYHQ